jgi:peptide chain release factor subunit 1
VPPTQAILDAGKRIASEIIEAENIKSRTTRQGVLAALQNVHTALKTLTATPPTGIAVFATPEKARTYVPAEPFVSRVYVCSNRFVLEPVEAMLESHQIYGLVVIDRKEASIGILQGTRTVPIKNLQSLVPQKVNRGGQSQARIQRQADNAVSEWIAEVAEAANKIFASRLDGMQAILVGGPGSCKDDWAACNKLDYRLRQKIHRQTFTTCYTDEHQGLKELTGAAGSAISNLELTAQEKLLDRFFAGIGTGDAVYGPAAVRDALADGTVETLILLDGPSDSDWVPGSARVVIVSDSTERGTQFAKMGGVGGLLRWRAPGS